MSCRVDNLTRFEKEDLVRWFCQLMDQEIRHRLMVERPVAYAKLTESSPHEWSFNLTDEVHNAARRGHP